MLEFESSDPYSILRCHFRSRIVKVVVRLPNEAASGGIILGFSESYICLGGGCFLQGVLGLGVVTHMQAN